MAGGAGCTPIRVRKSRLLNLMRWHAMLVVTGRSPCARSALEMGAERPQLTSMEFINRLIGALFSRRADAHGLGLCGRLDIGRHDGPCTQHVVVVDYGAESTPSPWFGVGSAKRKMPCGAQANEDDQPRDRHKTLARAHRVVMR